MGQSPLSATGPALVYPPDGNDGEALLRDSTQPTRNRWAPLPTPTPPPFAAVMARFVADPGQVAGNAGNAVTFTRAGLYLGEPVDDPIVGLDHLDGNMLFDVTEPIILAAVFFMRFFPV